MAMSTQTELDAIECHIRSLATMNGEIIMALSIRKVSAAVVPQSAHRGRTRQANDFDDYMTIYNADDHTDEDGNVTWDGWNAVDFSSNDELTKLTGHLTGASNHANVGVERRVDNMGQVLYFRIKVRTLKPRDKGDKPAKGDGNGVSEGTNGRTGTVTHESVDATVTELETHVADSDSPKRERKSA